MPWPAVRSARRAAAGVNTGDKVQQKCDHSGLYVGTCAARVQRECAHEWCLVRGLRSASVGVLSRARFCPPRLSRVCALSEWLSLLPVSCVSVTVWPLMSGLRAWGVHRSVLRILVSTCIIARNVE